MWGEHSRRMYSARPLREEVGGTPPYRNQKPLSFWMRDVSGQSPHFPFLATWRVEIQTLPAPRPPLPVKNIAGFASNSYLDSVRGAHWPTKLWKLLQCERASWSITIEWCNFHSVLLCSLFILLQEKYESCVQLKREKRGFIASWGKNDQFRGRNSAGEISGTSSPP